MSARMRFWLALLGWIILRQPAAAQDDRDVARFAGTYTGKYTFFAPGADEPQEGVITSTVDEKGNVTGEGTNTTVNQTAKHTGTIDADGRVKLVIEFPNATYTCVGTAAKTKKGGIVGTLIQKSGARMMGALEYEVTLKDSAKK